VHRRYAARHGRDNPERLVSPVLIDGLTGLNGVSDLHQQPRANASTVGRKHRDFSHGSGIVDYLRRRSSDWNVEPTGY
jgi:hypothetical protein